MTVTTLFIIGVVLFIVPVALLAYADFCLWRDLENEKRAAAVQPTPPARTQRLFIERRRGQVDMIDELAPTDHHTIRVLTEAERRECLRVVCPLQDWRAHLAGVLEPGRYRIQLIDDGPPKLTVGSTTVCVTEVTDDEEGGVRAGGTVSDQRGA